MELGELEKFHASEIQNMHEKVQGKARQDREITETHLRRLREELLVKEDELHQFRDYKELNEANNHR